MTLYIDNIQSKAHSTTLEERRNEGSCQRFDPRFSSIKNKHAHLHVNGNIIGLLGLQLIVGKLEVLVVLLVVNSVSVASKRSSARGYLAIGVVNRD
jgi:hypothetical protein